MKLALALCPLLFITVLNAGCSKSNSDAITSEIVPVTDEVESKDHVDEADKFKPTKNMVEIEPLRGTCTVKVGQQLYYSEHVHGSVGYAASASSNSKDLPLVKNFIEYDNPQHEKMAGGDSAREYFIFDALAPGSYEIVLQKHFRGDLESEYTVKVTVEAAK